MTRLAATTHGLISRKLILPLSRLQRMARPSRRAVIKAYYRGMQFRKQSRGWSLDTKLDWILSRLRFVVLRAYTDTDYYREKFDQIGFDPTVPFSFDEFSALPVLERNDVSGSARKLLSQAMPQSEMLRDSTGGSTGAPTEVWLGPEERGWKESAGESFMDRIGVPTGARTAFFWGHHLDPKTSATFRERLYDFETNSRFFDCLRLSPDLLDQYHQEFQRWRPDCIVAYASALGQLAEHICECGYRPIYPSRCMVTGAEKLLPHHREAISAAFGRPVHERYGGRDVGYVAFQVEPEENLTFEVDWSNILVEPETSDAESSILITKLHADAMPLIRYRVGDVAHFLPDSKPGHPAFLLNEIVGRDVDRIWLPDGRWITGLQIPHMMKDYPVKEYMFIQQRDYSVVIQIAPKCGFDESTNAKILETVKLNLPGLSISTVLVDEVPRTTANKWRPVISEIQVSRGRAA